MKKKDISDKLVCEIGLNHLGDKKYFKDYIKTILKLNLKFVTIQIREKSFYLNSKKDSLLPQSFLEKELKNLQKKKIKVGLAICDNHWQTYIPDFEADFFKILSWSALDLKLIKNTIKFKKNVYISLGMINEKKIDYLDKKLKELDGKFNYIYTQLNYNKKDLNLRAIAKISKKTINPISYGHHALDTIPILISLTYDVDKIFIYIKLNKLKKHNDEDHAFYPSEINCLLDKMEVANDYLGNETKTKSINEIELNE